MTEQQQGPFSLQVEATEGCNLRCGFCGIRGIRAAGTRGDLSGPYHYMTEGTAHALALGIAQAGWNPRIEFAMHGEPTMHPDLPRLVRIMRAHLPGRPIMVTTNGLPLLDAWPLSVYELFGAGADTVAVDDYRPHKARAAVLATRLPTVTVHEYPPDPAGNPHRRPRRGEHRLVLVADISQTAEGTHAHLSNHAGAAGPLDHSRDGERCALPFREMSVRWDGNVALCCNDWRGQFKVGNVNTTPVGELWQHEAFRAARRTLLAEGRTYAPCAGCTHRTYRNGLLPDKYGKQTLPQPGPGDRAAIDAALAGDPYARPVLRTWEVTKP